MLVEHHRPPALDTAQHCLSRAFALVLGATIAACATGSGEGVGDDIGPLPIDARVDSTSPPTDAPIVDIDALID